MLDLDTVCLVTTWSSRSRQTFLKLVVQVGLYPTLDLACRSETTRRTKLLVGRDGICLELSSRLHTIDVAIGIFMTLGWRRPCLDFIRMTSGDNIQSSDCPSGVNPGRQLLLFAPKESAQYASLGMHMQTACIETTGDMFTIFNPMQQPRLYF